MREDGTRLSWYIFVDYSGTSNDSYSPSEGHLYHVRHMQPELASMARCQSAAHIHRSSTAIHQSCFIDTQNNTTRREPPVNDVLRQENHTQTDRYRLHSQPPKKTTTDESLSYRRLQHLFYSNCPALL